MAVTIRTNKAAKLKNLEVTKVSLVGAGSNPKADIALFKSKNDKAKAEPKTEAKVKKTTYNELRAARAASNAMWKVYDRIYDLQDAIYMSASTPEDIPKSIKQFAADVDLILDELASGSYEKADPNAIRKAVLAKMADFATRIAPEEGEVMKAKIKKAVRKNDAPKPLEEMSKEEAIAELKKLRATAVEKDAADDEDEDEDEEDEDDEPVVKTKANGGKKLKKATKPVEKSEDEEDDDVDDDGEEVAGVDPNVMKSLPKPVVQLIKGMQQSLSAVEARASNAEKIAKKEVLRRERAEMLTKARKVMKHLPGTDEEKRDMLMGIYKTMPKEQADAIVKQFESASAAFEMLGEDQGADDAVTGSALEHLNTLAKEIAKDKNITFEQGFSKACDQRNDLYVQHRKESRSRAYAE